MKSKSSTFCPFSVANESQMSFRVLRIQNSGSFRALGHGPEAVILRHQLQGAGAGIGVGQKQCSSVTPLLRGSSMAQRRTHPRHKLGPMGTCDSRRESRLIAMSVMLDQLGFKPNPTTTEQCDLGQLVSTLSLCLHICKMKIIDPTASGVVRV